MKIKNIEQYLPLIKKIAGTYSNLPIPFDDLVQEGYIGILEAAKKYDPKKGTKFTTYATFWIKKKILAAIDKEKIKETTLIDENSAETSQKQAETEYDDTSLDLPKDIPEIEKKILILLYEKKFTLKEISKKLDMKYEKVRRLKELAKRRLKVNISPKKRDTILPENMQ